MKETRGILHNPGYDFYRAVYFIAQEDSLIPDKLIAPYFRPIICIMCACACVEGYVHTCAQRINSKWNPEDFPREPIRKRIERAYELINKKPCFTQNPYKGIMDMFRMRNKLTHPVLQHEVRLQNKSIKTVFEQAEAHYTSKKILALTEQFKKTIIKDFGLHDVWHMSSKNMPVYDLSPDENCSL